MDRSDLIIALQERISSLEIDVGNLRAERDAALRSADRDHAALMVRQAWLKEFYRRSRWPTGFQARDIQAAIAGKPVNSTGEKRNARRRKACAKGRDQGAR